MTGDEQKAIYFRERMYNYLESMSSKLKNAFPARTRWNKKIEQVLIAACEEPLTDEEYYMILRKRVGKIIHDIERGDRVFINE